MKKFVSKSIIIIFTMFVIIYGAAYSYYTFSKKQVNNKLKNLSIYECLLIGSSHMQRINPKYFKLKTKNISTSGEHSYFTCEKLKTIISFNNSIKFLIIDISPISFGPMSSKFLNLERGEGVYSLYNHLYFINSIKESSFLTFFDFFSPTMVKAVFTKPNFGGLVITKKSNPNKTLINKQIKRLWNSENDNLCCDEEYLKYLIKIDSICTYNNINLILVCLPNHGYFKEKINKFYTNCLNQGIKQLKTKHYLDFYSDHQINNNLMSDGDHLNEQGSEIYSKKISNYTMKH